MVPYHRPIPERKAREGKGGAGGGIFNAWVQAEKLMQIAMMLPSAGFIGWLAGYGLDRWLHQTWIGIVGAVFGIIAGLVAAVRMAIAYGADPASNKADENGHGDDTGDSGKTS
jgi:ATP synthase protein I